MFSLIPVDHDPFADPPAKLIPVDHDPFAVGPVAQPADPGIAAAGTAAPQLVPVDYDPFTAARTDALPRIIVHPKSPNAPPDNSAGADGPDERLRSHGRVRPAGFWGLPPTRGVHCHRYKVRLR